MSVKRGMLCLKLHLSYINLPFILRVSIVYLTCIYRVSYVGNWRGKGREKEEKWRRNGRGKEDKWKGEGGQKEERRRRNGGEKLYFSFLFA